MRQNLQASLATILLLFSVFACSKENTSNNSGGNTQLAISSAGVMNSLADESSADAKLESSDWTWYYDWECDGQDGATTITFNDDGTWTSGDYNGYWYKEVSKVMLEFNTGDCPPTTYAGNIRNRDTIQGMMVSFAGETGCFRMVNGVSPKFKAVTPGADVNGKMPGAY